MKVEWGENAEFDQYPRERHRPLRRFPLHQSRDEEADFLPTPPVNGNLTRILQTATDALRRQLILVGLTDPWLLDRADIYQKSFITLANTLDHTELSPETHSQADAELFLLATTLEGLFTDQISLRNIRHRHGFKYEGYFERDSHSFRVSIFNSRTHYLPSQGRKVYANSQIEINPIEGRNTRKKPISGSQSVVRCGLRCYDDGGNYYWEVSLDSGFKRYRDSIEWKTIGPLSQTINLAKTQGIDSLSLDDGSYTFHFQDKKTLTENSFDSALKFQEFNYYLNLVFSK